MRRAFLFVFYQGFLAAPLTKHGFLESAPLQFCLEGGIPGTDGNAALVLFRGTQGGQGKEDAMRKLMNRWKSGTTGLLIMVASSVVVIGCGGDSDKSSSRRVPKDTLVVKGLYMGMPGDDAVKACKEMAGSSKDLVVVDFRNGIEREKDEATKAREKKEYEETVKLAEADVDRFLRWSGIHGEFYDPSADECTARGVAEKDLRPYVNSGSKTAPIPGANWVVGTAMASFAGMYGYQVEWMLPGKRKGGGHEASAPKLFSGKVAVPEEKRDSDPYAFWNSNVLANGLINNLYAKGLQLSKENDKRVFFRLSLEDAQGNPVDKKKLATELVLNNPQFFEEFSSNQEKIEAAEKEVDGFFIWVEFLNDKVSILDPEDPRPEDVKERDKKYAERMAEMEKRGDARGLTKMQMAKGKGASPAVAKRNTGAPAVTKTNSATPSPEDTAELNKMKAELKKMEKQKASLDAEIADLGKELKRLSDSGKKLSEQVKKNPSLKKNPAIKKRHAENKARFAETKERYDAAKEKRKNAVAAIADMKAQIASKETEVRKEIAAQRKAVAEAKAAEEKAAADKKAADESALAKRNRTDLRFLTAARTGSYRRVTSDYAFQFSQTMMKMACNCKVMLEWAVLTEPADKPEEITEVFSIPAGDSESAIKLVSKLNSDLGLNKFLQQGSPRARRYFEKDLADMKSPLWFRLVLKATNGVEVAKADAVKNWLEARGHYPPSDKLIIPKKNLIQISIKKDGVREDKLAGLCFVWIDDQGNVRQAYFNENGMDRFFNAEDLSCEEFAHALVKNYAKIPSLEPQVKRDDLEKGSIQETTWIYKAPKGYQVKLFERVFLDVDGRRYDSKLIAKLSKSDPELAMGVAVLGLADKRPEKFLVFSAIKPQSERKFD